MKRTINQNEYNFSEDDIAIEKLHFWPENPRIHADIYSIYASAKDVDYNDSQLQVKIYQELKRRDNVRELRSQLEATGGLTEALIVRKSPQGDYYDVLEGNRRLAACKMNHETSNYQKFTHLPCEIVPDDMSDGNVLSLLGILHIHGKDEWSPFAKASFIKRKVEEYISDGCGKEEAKNRLREELHISPQEIEKSMITIDLMEYANEEKRNKYSYYEVITTNKDTKKIIDSEWGNEPEDRPKTKRIIGAIKDWESKATEFRSAFQDVFKDKKAEKKFFDRSENLKGAAEFSRDNGSADELLNKVKRFRKNLENIDSTLKIVLTDPTAPLHKKLEFEFKKLHKLVEGFHKHLSKPKEEE